jgi:hypothetical protein
MPEAFLSQLRGLVEGADAKVGLRHSGTSRAALWLKGRVLGHLACTGESDADADISGWVLRLDEIKQIDIDVRVVPTGQRGDSPGISGRILKINGNTLVDASPGLQLPDKRWKSRSSSTRCSPPTTDSKSARRRGRPDQLFRRGLGRPGSPLLLTRKSGRPRSWGGGWGRPDQQLRHQPGRFHSRLPHRPSGGSPAASGARSRSPRGRARAEPRSARRRRHFTFDACVASYARQLDQRPVVSDGPGCAIGNELNLNKVNGGFKFGF